MFFISRLSYTYCHASGEYGREWHRMVDHPTPPPESQTASGASNNARPGGRARPSNVRSVPLRHNGELASSVPFEFPFRRHLHAPRTLEFPFVWLEFPFVWLEFPFVWSQFPFVWPVAASYSRSAEALFPFVTSNSRSFHLPALVVAVMRVLAMPRVSPPMARHGR